MLIFSQRHLRVVLAAYVRHYKGCREGSYDLVPCDQVWGLGLVEIYMGNWSLMGCRGGAVTRCYLVQGV